MLSQVSIWYEFLLEICDLGLGIRQFWMVWQRHFWVIKVKDAFWKKHTMKHPTLVLLEKHWQKAVWEKYKSLKCKSVGQFDQSFVKGCQHRSRSLKKCMR